jgi:hypothetical protein
MYLGNPSKGERKDSARLCKPSRELNADMITAERVFGIRDHPRMIDETEVGFLDGQQRRNLPKGSVKQSIATDLKRSF